MRMVLPWVTVSADTWAGGHRRNDGKTWRGVAGGGGGDVGVQHRVPIHRGVGQGRQVQRRGDVLGQRHTQRLQHWHRHGVQRGKVGQDAFQGLLNFQHVLVAMAVIVPPGASLVVAAVPTMLVATGVVVDALVVAVAVGIVGVEVTRMLMCGHGCASGGDVATKRRIVC